MNTSSLSCINNNRKILSIERSYEAVRLIVHNYLFFFIHFNLTVYIRKLCKQKGAEIIEANACKDHIHMLVTIPPNLRVAQFVGYLKGKSSLMKFDRHANLKYKYANRHFWCRVYYVDTVVKNEKAIREYVKNQLQDNIAGDQISIQEYVDPFTGEKVKKNK